MTDDFDVSLRRRLESLASAVPVAPPGAVTAVVRQPVRARSTSRLALAGLLPVLAVVVIGAVVATVLKIGPGPGDSSSGSTDAANGPIEATTRSGDFALTLRSAKARYAVAEPIEIEAVLAYSGTEPVLIRHGYRAWETAVGFGIEEPVLGDLRLGPGQEDICAATTLEPGQLITIPFQKSGAWSGDHPRSDEYLAYVQDPGLQLSEGTWHVFAVAGFSIDECTPNLIELRVDLAIEVAGTLAPADGPVVATDSSGYFELTIRSPKGRYEAGEPIVVEATFTYAGEEPIEIWDNEGDGEPLTFGIEEPVVGGLILGPGGRLPCLSATLEPSQTQNSDFVKSGGWSSDDPYAAEIEAFLRDPELRLSEGTWHIWAGAGFSLEECGGERVEMRAEIPIEVTPRAPTSSLDPLPPAWTAIDILTASEPASGCYQAYTEGRLTRHRVTGLGIGQELGKGVVWPYGFTAREEVGVAVLVGPNGQVVAREGQGVGFSGPGASGEDGLIHACGEVRIVDVDPTDDAGNDDVVAVDDDGIFRLELRSSKPTYAAGEAIDIDATLFYLGRGQTDFHGGIQFMGTQTDGTHSFAPGPTVAMCVPRAIRDLPDELELGDWRKVPSLPPGAWRISAWFSGSAPACSTGDMSTLRVSIDITVTATSDPIESITLTTSIDSSQHSSEDYCGRGLASGDLALHPTTGLGLSSPSGDLQAIRWPTGFAAEILPDGAILYGEGGQIVAREGESVSYPGANAPDGVFTICGQFLFP